MTASVAAFTPYYVTVIGITYVPAETEVAMKTDISINTYKNLFSASANRCAHPGCEAVLAEPSREGSSVMISGRACRIHVVNEEGSRGKPGILREELDSQQNLVLLCPEHCAAAADRHESFTAADLALWKREREEEGRGVDFFESAGISADAFLGAIVAREIESAVDGLRKFRFFKEVESAGHSLRLYDRLSRGDLFSGSDTAKSRAFAWCARILALEGDVGRAEKCLEAAKELHASTETVFAEAFVANGKGDAQGASESLRGVGSPESLSAIVEMIWRSGGPWRAVEWIKGAGIDSTDLDSDGEYVLLNCQLELARWDSARALVDVFGEEHPQNTPALHYLIAVTRLLRAVPDELRPALRGRPPFHSEEFYLFPSEIGEREKAHEHFLLAASAAHSAGCFSMAKKCEEYLFWLRLSHPEHSTEAARQLKQRFTVPGAAFHLAPLGLYFGIVPDHLAVEKEVLRAAAFRGRISRDEAYARAAIASCRGPEGTASAARKRLPEDFAEYLRVFRGEGLSEADCEEVATVVGDPRPGEGDGSLERGFQETDSLTALMKLADELEALGRFEEFCVYGETLFERTRSLRNAERLVSAFSRTGNTGSLVGFVEENRELLDASQRITSLYLQALCDEGEMARLRSEMERTGDGFENPESLIDFSVFTGGWSGLGAAVSDQYSEKASSCARSLAELVGFASRLGLRGAGEIGKAAAEVLASALAAASEAGWEENADLDLGFKKIVSLSGREDPFPRGCARLLRTDSSSESDIFAKLVRGDIPLFPASRFLGKSLFDLLFVPALENLSEKEASRKRPVPVGGGEKTQPDIPAGATAGFDCTALVTLGFLNLLEEGFDAFEEVFVTHSTLAWLFAEKVNASFYRREQVKDARALSRLIERELIGEFHCRGVSNAELSSRIGQDLASMIEEAGRRGGGAQRLVVRSAPVYRVDSLVKEQVDLAGHSDVLASCSSVAAALRKKCELTAEAEQSARVYLRLLGTPWPREPEIADGAWLYLDAASAACFFHLGILGKLKRAGFRVFIPRISAPETDFLLSCEKNSEEISACIERVRSVLGSRIESGKVRVASRIHTATPESCLVHGNTVSGLRALADICDVIVSDDGFFKGRGSARLPAQTLSTPDILRGLESSGAISSRQLRQYRDTLENAGYPVASRRAYS